MEEPDLDLLLLRLSEANEKVSQAFIQQSLAWNDLQNGLRALREKQPDLFTSALS